MKVLRVATRAVLPMAVVLGFSQWPGVERSAVALTARGAEEVERAVARNKSANSAGGAQAVVLTGAPDSQIGVDPQLLSRVPHSNEALTAASPFAVDPTNLLVTKTRTGSVWQINMTWSGGTGPYTALTANDPSFQSGVV